MEAICCEMSWLRSCLLIRLQDKTQFPPESCSLQTTRCQVSVQRCVGPDHALLEPLLSQLHILTCQSCVSSGQLFQSEHLSVFIYLHLSSDFRLSLSECGQGSLLFIRLVRVIAYGIKVSFALRSVWGYLGEDERQWGRFCWVCFLGITAVGLTPYRTEGQRLKPRQYFVGEHKVHGLGLYEEEQFTRI